MATAFHETRFPVDVAFGSVGGPERRTDIVVLGTGDGTTATFALRKRYGGSDAPFYRPIEKPVAGTVRVSVGGVERTSPAGFSVDVTTGIVTFPAGQRPAAGALVTAGFEFDVPARFDTDRLEINLQAFAAGALPAIPIVEIRP